MKCAILALALCLFLVPHVSAQEVAPDAEQTQPVEAKKDTTFVAPVVVEGETLFLVRGSSVLPANKRAASIVERIIEVAELPSKVTITYSVRPNEFGKAIFANERIITVATAADAELEQFEIDILANLQLEAIKGSIEQYRHGRSDEARVGSAIAAVGWTALFLLMTVFAFGGRLKVYNLVETIVEKRVTQVEEATGSVVRGKAVSQLVVFLVRALFWIAYILLFYYYLTFVLLAFAETRPIAQILVTYISEPLVNILFSFVYYAPNLILLVIIYHVTKFIVRALRLFMDNIEAGIFMKGKVEPHWITPTFNIGRVVIIAIGVVFAYPYIPGSDSRAFQGLTILAGVMLSLGSNTVISNLMSGLFVVYRRSANVGDRIQVGNKIGDVVEIRLMETLIKSIKNEMISIPNAQMLNSEVTNYSRKIDGRGILVHSTVGIGYEEAPEKIEAMLIRAATRTKDLKKTPKPFVLFTALADYAINYEINAFTTRGASLPQIRSDLHRNIVAVFNENKVQIMTPSYMADTEVPKVATEQWDGKLFGDDDET